MISLNTKIVTFSTIKTEISGLGKETMENYGVYCHPVHVFRFNGRYQWVSGVARRVIHHVEIGLRSRDA